MKFEPAQIVRKSTQVHASPRKPMQVGDQTRYKSTQVRTCDDLRSRLIRPLLRPWQKFGLSVSLGHPSVMVCSQLLRNLVINLVRYIL